MQITITIDNVQNIDGQAEITVPVEDVIANQEALIASLRANSTQGRLRQQSNIAENTAIDTTISSNDKNILDAQAIIDKLTL